MEIKMKKVVKMIEKGQQFASGLEDLEIFMILVDKEITLPFFEDPHNLEKFCEEDRKDNKELHDFLPIMFSGE